MSTKPFNLIKRGLTKRMTARKNTTSYKGMDTDNKVANKEITENPNAIVEKTLSSQNPSNGYNTVNFSYIENKFKTVPEETNYLEILNIDECILHNDDMQSQAQKEYHEKKNKLKNTIRNEGKTFNEKEVDSYKSLRNNLTYCVRASETAHKVILDKEVSTTQLERVDHSGICHEWQIFDTYMADFILKKLEKKRDDEFKLKGKAEELKRVEVHQESLSRPSLLKALKLLERQIMQIANKDKYKFYREWSKYDDSNDSSRMLFWLLSFPDNARIKNKSVTALCWNDKFEDLFAVGFGSYDFPMKKEDKVSEADDRNDEMLEKGLVYVFSIKNNYFPEVKYTTESSVLCLDFHPKEPALLVVGMYDGTVCVYDISKKIETPVIACNIRTQKHMDPVWQVRWYVHEIPKDEYVFYSISSDGKVIRWSYLSNKTLLETEEVILLKYSDNLQDTQSQIASSDVASTQQNTMNMSISESGNKDKQDEALAFGNAGGTCFDFNKHKGFEHLFIVGTEEGRIYLCSTKHREHTIRNYEGHTMGTYTVTWNPFHPKVFASCSADWTIKIWHYNVYAPLVVYDVQSAVGDLSWSPWCSTIFASVNVEGEIQFFDLNRARRTKIDKKKQNDTPINHIAFNKNEFVFIVGTDKGKVYLWKMAEPLRVTVDRKAQEWAEREQKAKAASMNSKPTTKIVVPQNLQDLKKKKEAKGLEKKQAMKDLNPATEKRESTSFWIC